MRALEKRMNMSKAQPIRDYLDLIQQIHYRLDGRQADMKKAHELAKARDHGICT